MTTFGVLTGLAAEGWDPISPEAVIGGWSSAPSPKAPAGLSRFEVEEGNDYQVAGAGAAAASDLDICVFHESGESIACDTALDGVPRVAFAAPSSGVFSASLDAPAVTRTEELDRDGYEPA